MDLGKSVSNSITSSVDISVRSSVGGTVWSLFRDSPEIMGLVSVHDSVRDSVLAPLRNKMN